MIGQSVSDWSVGRSVSLSVIGQSVGRSVGQSVSQSVSQSASQSVSQSVSQSNGSSLVSSLISRRLLAVSDLVARLARMYLSVISWFQTVLYIYLLVFVAYKLGLTKLKVELFPAFLVRIRQFCISVHVRAKLKNTNALDQSQESFQHHLNALLPRTRTAGTGLL